MVSVPVGVKGPFSTVPVMVTFSTVPESVTPLPLMVRIPAPLMVVPALLWVGIFLVATFLLSDLRHVLRRGEFRLHPAGIEV